MYFIVRNQIVHHHGWCFRIQPQRFSQTTTDMGNDHLYENDIWIMVIMKVFCGGGAHTTTHTQSKPVPHQCAEMTVPLQLLKLGLHKHTRQQPLSVATIAHTYCTGEVSRVTTIDTCFCLCSGMFGRQWRRCPQTCSALQSPLSTANLHFTLFLTSLSPKQFNNKRALSH